MKIQNSSIDLQRAAQQQGVQGGSDSSQKQSVAPVPAVSRTDRVQISEAGRALAAQKTESPEAVRAELSPERLQEVRQRILGGAYNSMGVVEDVARRMLERGDI